MIGSWSIWLKLANMEKDIKTTIKTKPCAFKIKRKKIS